MMKSFIGLLSSLSSSQEELSVIREEQSSGLSDNTLVLNSNEASKMNAER